MKVICLIIILLLIGDVAFAGFTVQKVDDNIGKIITTETITKEDNVTILSLKQRKANLLLNKEQALTQYNNTLKTINNEIALIDSQIAKLITAGVVEPVIKELIQ